MAFLGVILAGGKSERMGRDKATMQWQGESWLSHMASLLKTAGAKEVIVCGREAPPYVFLPDIYPNAGPLGGIHAALRYSLSVHQLPLLIVPVDIPSATAEDLVTLVQHSNKAEAVTYKRSPLPIYLNADASQLTNLEAILNNDTMNNAIHHWLENVLHFELPVSPPFKNINRLSDLEA
ncbi:molybdenum cofactor guanylyltransferase [Alteromonas sediminis]|nr:molybdenum cofactor guanylyltransferase [Alteromonas sediminis]